MSLEKPTTELNQDEQGIDQTTEEAIPEEVESLLQTLSSQEEEVERESEHVETTLNTNSSGWWEGNKSKANSLLKSGILAASLMLGSFVAAGCEDTNASSTQETSQEVRDVNTVENYKKLKSEGLLKVDKGFIGKNVTSGPNVVWVHVVKNNEATKDIDPAQVVHSEYSNDAWEYKGRTDVPESITEVHQFERAKSTVEKVNDIKNNLGF